MASLHTAASLGRLGTESAFEVLARAQGAAGAGQVDHLACRSASRTSRPRRTSSRPRSRRCATAITATPPANGIPQLREAVAEDIAAPATASASIPSASSIVPGGKVTMYFAIAMFGEPGAEIIYPNPGFPIYHSVIKLRRRQRRCRCA